MDRSAVWAYALWRETREGELSTDRGEAAGRPPWDGQSENGRRPAPATSELSDIQRASVLSQLNRILESAPFRASKRYPAFLKYVVEQTLDGHGENLKERTLGIDVFARHLDYDTNADPIVRIIAAEVRKRLAQYYYEDHPFSSPRIELPSGAYVAEFHFSRSGAPAEGTANAIPLSVVDADTPICSKSEHGRSLGKRRDLVALSRLPRPWLRTLAGIAILSIVAGALQYWPRPDATQRFWRPLLQSSRTVLICMGQLHVTQVELNPNSARSRFATASSLHPDGWPAAFGLTAIGDSATVANVAGLLRIDKRDFAVKDKDSTTFADLQTEPFVLIGAFSNDWTIRMTDSLRYHFDMNPTEQEWWIEDSQKPGEQIGLHRTNLPESALKEDYAIVARFLDPSTKQPAVILAGVDGYGTLVAGDFVTKSNYLADFAKQAPGGWDSKNMEIVIAARIVDGQPGPPRVVASYFW